MLKLLINNGDGKGAVDYTRYVIPSSINIEDSINTPTLVSFTLANADGLFKVPVRSAYVAFVSTLSPLSLTGTYVATGYVTNEIQRKFLGMGVRASSQGFQHYEYDVKVTSDEYLLNQKAVPFIAAYINRTMGQILTDLANVLAPGFFDTTNVGAGDMVPYFQYDPTNKWSDVAKQFADQAQYRYKVIGKKIYFQPYGDAALGIVYNENQPQTKWNPANLDSGVLAVPLVNDCIVIGEVEPQQMWDDYFVGDGFTGNFPLKYKMFHGDSDLMLQDDWTEQTFNNSMWTVRDLFGQFILAGALNALAISGQNDPNWQTYIVSKNGVELGGHVTIQHGEVQFNDVSNGIIGGLYQNTSSFAPPNCIAGFSITSNPSTVSLTASGANGIVMQPMLSGALVGSPVVSVQNHHYILETYITARQWSRYNQIYRTLAGTPFGDAYLPALAEITFAITDIDLAQAYNVATLMNPFVPAYTPQITRTTLTGIPLPSFAAYAVMVSQRMNVTINYTMIWQPPNALLQVAGLTGARPTNVLALTGGQMPLYDPNDNLSIPDTTPIGNVIAYPMGFGMDQSVYATIALKGDTDQLEFYSNTIPGVGARIRLMAWEAGQSVARVQSPVSISSESIIVGDNGLRSAIVTDMQPKPRTSYECDLAAAATILDKINPQFDGTYTIESYFWDPTAGFPVPGRFLNVTAPQRNISGQNLLVRQVTTTVLEMFQEVYEFAVSFGQDLYLEKLLRRFVDQPTNVTTPTDTAVAPDPQNLPTAVNVGQFNTYLGNLQDAKLSFVNGTQITVDLGAPPVTGVEVRRSDTGWGTGKATNNLVGIFTTQTFTLPRGGIDQVWYMRQVNGTQISRFTRAMHVNYPMVPQPPSAVTSAVSVAGEDLEFTLTAALPTSFDKNIYGLEINQYYDLSVPSNINLVSDNPSDTRTGILTGTDRSGNYISNSIILNGTTPVSSLSQFASLEELYFTTLVHAGNVSVETGVSTVGVAPSSGLNFQMAKSLYKYANLTLPYSPNDPGLAYSYSIDPNTYTVSTLAANFFNLLNERSQPVILAGASVVPINPPIIFEPPLRMCTSGLPELWIVASCKDPAYLGCLSYMSTDSGGAYHPTKDITGSEFIFGNATTGYTISGDWPAHLDVDADDTLTVDLSESLGSLASYQLADENNFRYPCYVSASGAFQGSQIAWATSVSGGAGYGFYAGIGPDNQVSYAVPTTSTSGSFGLVACHTRGPYVSIWGNGYGSVPIVPGACGESGTPPVGPGGSGNLVVTAAEFEQCCGQPCAESGQSRYLLGNLFNIPNCPCPPGGGTSLTAVGLPGNILDETPGYFQYDFESISALIKNTGGYGGVVAQGFFGKGISVGPLTYDDVTFPSTNNLAWQSINFAGGGGSIAIVKMLAIGTGHPLYVAFVMGASPYTTGPDGTMKPWAQGWNLITQGASVCNAFALTGSTIDVQSGGPYELMAYLTANAISGAASYAMPAISGGGGPLRRAVFGMPTPGMGTDHPIGSRWAWLNDRLTNKPSGIIKIPLDPAWIGQTLYFKFPAFNSRGGIEKKSTTQVYSYQPTGLAFPQFSPQPTYVQSPLKALTQTNATTVTMSQVTESFAGNTIKYNARTFTIATPPSTGQTYYVTIYDPYHLGDVGQALTQQAYIDTDQTRTLTPGYTYIGSVVAVPSGFSQAIVTPGGWPPGDVLLVNGT